MDLQGIRKDARNDGKAQRVEDLIATSSGVYTGRPVRIVRTNDWTLVEMLEKDLLRTDGVSVRLKVTESSGSLPLYELTSYK
jgi:hypothetical protein